MYFWLYCAESRWAYVLLFEGLKGPWPVPLFFIMLDEDFDIWAWAAVEVPG